tara:strand:+ start:63 stop:950 length:888 start_codon:yes stop_codon:yes gene_type:complete
MLKAKQIHEFLETEYHGTHHEIDCFTTIDEPKKNSILFIKNRSNKTIEKLNYHDDCFIVFPKEMENFENFKKSWGYIFVDNPRETFFKLIDKFFTENKPNLIENTSKISKETTIGSNVGIGMDTIIQGNVIIGNNVNIGSNSLIIGPCNIGSNTNIASGVIIGEESLSISYEKGNPIQNPQLGGVTIGKNSRIGVFSTISRGSISNTILGDNVFLGEYTHVGHNSMVCSNSVMTLRSSICGSVVIEKESWLGPHSVILNGVKVKEKIKLGINSSLQTDAKRSGTYFGNPAKILEF